MRISKENKGKDKVVWKDVEKADSILKHVKGIMFRKKIEKPILFIFKKEAPVSIHSYFCVPFDIIYLDKAGRITRAEGDVKEGRVLPAVKCKYIIECRAGEIKKKGLKKGDVLSF